MSTANALRRQIETTLAHRMAAPLTTRERSEPERVACGIAALDELLQGGLPVGVITELAGAACSGRTTMALAYMAAVARDGNVCAWIDVADALDPECVAANGVDLARMLWVRCGSYPRPSTAVGPTTGATPSASAVAPAHPGLPVRGGGSPHPRAEGRDMPQAISAMLGQHGGLYDHQKARESRRNRRSIGTPGAPNRPIASPSGGDTHRSINREEQVSTDRVPSRRQQQNFAARCAEAQPRVAGDQPRDPRIAAVVSKAHPVSAMPAASVPARTWDALDQALKTADLLLQAGGFSAIVLDLAGTSPEFALRIPLATWFRFRAACERTRVSLLLLTQQPCARSSAELVVRLQPGHMDAEGNVMTGIRYHSATERGRRPEKVVAFAQPARKPPQSERGQWSSRAMWAQR